MYPRRMNIKQNKSIVNKKEQREMINLEALKNAKKTKLYIIKEAPNINLWKVVPYDESPYYAIIKTIDEDNSITIIKEKLRMAIRMFNKLKRSQNQ